MHNYGLAFDICLELDGKIISWDVDKDFDDDRIADWMEVVDVFKALGFKWGGDWKTLKDMPHFEVDVPLEVLKRLYANQMFIEGSKYVSLLGVDAVVVPKGVEILV